MWEEIDNAKVQAYGQTHRMKVPGGWIVRTITSGYHVAQTFVPDEKHEWKLEEKK